jgi:hypothetical protein
MQCPKCKSEDAVKLSVVHAAGLSDIQSSARGHAWALGDSGLLLGFSSSQAIGTSQTALSKLAAPPCKKRYRHVILTWLIGLALGSWFILVIISPTGSLGSRTLSQMHRFAFLFSTVIVLMLAVLWRFNHMIFPRRRELWNRSFMCQRCGEIFQLPVERCHS